MHRLSTKNLTSSLFRVLGGKHSSVFSERVGCRRQSGRTVSMAAAEQWKAATGRKVFVTHQVPQQGVAMLKSAGCVVTQWDSVTAIPRDELMKGVQGCDAIFCILTTRIDKHVLDAAGYLLTSAAAFRV